MAEVAMVAMTHTGGPRLSDVSHHNDFIPHVPFLRVDIYVTGAAKREAQESPTSLPSGVRLLRGRPSSDYVVSGVVLEASQVLDVSAQQAAKVTCALACGPAPLISDVTKACLHANVSLHNEVFSL
jgi:hypothetical protein